MWASFRLRSSTLASSSTCTSIASPLRVFTTICRRPQRQVSEAFSSKTGHGQARIHRLRHSWRACRRNRPWQRRHADAAADNAAASTAHTDEHRLWWESTVPRCAVAHLEAPLQSPRPQQGRAAMSRRQPSLSFGRDFTTARGGVAAGKANDLAIGGGPTQKPLERRRPKAWPPARKVRHGGGDRGSDAILPGNQLIMQCSPASLAKNLGQRTQDVRVLGHFCPACLSARQSKQVLPGIIACTLT